MRSVLGLKHSVKARVTLVTLLVLVVGLWVLAGYATSLLRRDIEQRASVAQNTSVVLLANQINEQLIIRLQTLDAVAKGITAEQQFEPALLQAALQERALLPTLFNGGALVFDEDGAVLVSIPTQAGRQAPRLALTPANKTVLNQLTRAVVAPPSLGPLRQVPVLSLVAPLPTVGASPKRWLAGIIELRGNSFLDHLGALFPERTSSLMVVAGEQRVIVAATDPLRAMTRSPTTGVEPDVDAAMTGATGTHIVASAKGVPVLLSVAAIPAANWHLAGRLPLSEVFGPIEQVQQQLLLVAALLTLITGGATWWYLRRQFKPLVAAADTLAQLSNTEKPTQAKGDEVGLLMARINQLLAQIRERERELDVQTDELTQINQQLQAILQHVPQLVWLKDLQGRYITCNARFEAFFDLPVASVQGRSDDDFFPPEQAQLYREDDQICLQSRTMMTTQRWLASAESAHEVLLEVNKIALHDAQGRVQALLGIGQDITERWRLSQFGQLRSKVLELVVQDGALPLLLQTLADGLHGLRADWSCALFLVQAESEPARLRVMASAGLDEDFVHALDGLVVSDGICSCATAASSGKRVVVSDLAKSETTKDYRERAQRAGLGASWSQPLFDVQRKVIGVFSVYQKAALAPNVRDVDLLVQLTRLAEIALERAHAGERLRASESSFRALTENTPEAVVVHRLGTVVYANPAAVQLFGASSLADLLSKSTTDLVAPEFQSQQAARMRALQCGDALTATEESRFVRLDGSAFDVEVQGTAIVFDGQPAIHVSIRDVTQRAQTRRQLQLAASVFEHALEGILITTASGNIVDVNAAFTRITGYERRDVLGKNPRLLQSGRHDALFYQSMWGDLLRDGVWSGELSNRRKDGQVYTQMLHVSAVRDKQGAVLHYVGLFADITARKDQEERLNYLAHFDSLTGLPNRALHADRLRQAMANVMRRQKKLGVAFVDLDGFKTVNDESGHDAGDQVLITVANRMRQALREVDTLSRIGGDEFAAIIVDLDYESDCDPLLHRLLIAANEPVLFNGQQLQVSASVGVTFYPQHEDTSPDQLMRQADQAMYQAKRKGKNRMQVSGFADLPE